MKLARRNRSLVFALYLNAALLAAVVVLLASRGSSILPSATAAPITPGPIAGGNGLYVMPAQFLSTVWGCYILDTEKQSLSAYAFYGNTGSGRPELRLIASRGISQDRQLTNFNTGPDPEDIRKLVQLGQQPTKIIRPQNPPATDPNDNEKNDPQQGIKPQPQD
jgi:hypothetical protein